jgi:hypothetical protein
MYQTFNDAGEPLPKDQELIEYGFDYESMIDQCYTRKA